LEVEGNLERDFLNPKILKNHGFLGVRKCGAFSKIFVKKFWRTI
jgi:hypothetical protein